MNTPNSFAQLVFWLLVSTLAVSALFTAFPQMDIAVSALFYRDGFWLHDLWVLQAIRQVLIWLMYAFAAGTLLAFVVARVRRQPSKHLAYGMAVILAGPLLLVNSILKNNWGRARPSDISLFGGDKEFTPAYLFTDQCGFNCSFTSGEGAGIATLAILSAFWFWPRLGRAGRLRLGASLAALVGLGAGLRIVVGRHFLSDTLLSILFCALVAVGLYKVFYRWRPEKTYSVGYQQARALHPAIGEPIELAVPSAARHRPAVKSFMNGKYYEAFSHSSFKKILSHRQGNAVHAGAFFGDMLHTLSQSANTVYAFEPVLDNYVLAKLNTAKLGLENVMLFNAGLAAAPGWAMMQVRSDSGVFAGGASAIVAGESTTSPLFERVPVFALDDLPISNVTLLHLDVESYELEVLNGAKRLIAESKPVILLEDNAKNCAPFLEAQGYRFCFHHGTLDYWASPDDYAFICQLAPA